MSADVAQLNFVVRALIRVMYGTALQPGSHAEAAAAYRRAAQLNPQRAKNHLLAAMGLDIEDINAHLTRLEGELMLASLQQHEPQPSSDEDEEAAPHDSPASGNSAAAA
jgi:hypothetical protein